jgi:hypothetical protein
VAVPLRDADPTVLTLVWRRDNRNPLLGELVAAARALAASADQRAAAPSDAA